MGDDGRVFLRADGWRPAHKADDGRLFCHRRGEGKDYFHHILAGEIYITNGQECYCLPCAKAAELLTADRPTLDESRARLQSAATGGEGYRVAEG